MVMQVLQAEMENTRKECKAIEEMKTGRGKWEELYLSSYRYLFIYGLKVKIHWSNDKWKLAGTQYTKIQYVTRKRRSGWTHLRTECRPLKLSWSYSS
jgi:hypothetical protein